MIRHLRLRFICVIMVIVPLMLVVIFGIVINMTSSSMEMQSISMMQTIAASPFQLGSLGIPIQEVIPLLRALEERSSPNAQLRLKTTGRATKPVARP